MKCGTIRVFLQEGLDGPLSPPDEAMVEAHLLDCERCRRYQASLQLSVVALEDLSRHAAPLDLARAISRGLGPERARRHWTLPAAIAAAVLCGVVLAIPSLHGTRPVVAESSQALQAQIAADQATAEFMHWMDPAADGGSGLAVQQAAFDTAVSEGAPGPHEPVGSPGQ